MVSTTWTAAKSGGERKNTTTYPPTLFWHTEGAPPHVKRENSLMVFPEHTHTAVNSIILPLFKTCPIHPCQSPHPPQARARGADKSTALKPYSDPSLGLTRNISKGDQCDSQQVALATPHCNTD
ncbi:unnamed protein product [Ectocarpus sp. 6 AP-2014]